MKSYRTLSALVAFAFLACILTSCGPTSPPIDPNLTLEVAKQNLRSVGDEVITLIPEGSVVHIDDDWDSTPTSLLSCGTNKNAYEYSRTTRLTLNDKSHAHEILDSVHAHFSEQSDWQAVWDTYDDPPAALHLLESSGMYVIVRVVGEDVRITGFSECFVGDEYNLLDKY